MNSFLKKLLLFILILFLYFLPSLLFRTDRNFYYSLNRPFYSPKPIVFFICWTILYVIFSYILTKKITEKSLSKESVIAFSINYFVSFFYNYAFFIKHNLFLSFAITLLSFLSGILIFITLLKQNRYNSFLVTPYLLWTLFASILMANIYIIN